MDELALLTLDSLTIESVSDWVEVVNERKVGFHNLVSVRPIPAAGRCRTVSEHKNIGRRWADEDTLERGIDALTEQEDESDDECGFDDWVEKSPIDDIRLQSSEAKQGTSCIGADCACRDVRKRDVSIGSLRPPRARANPSGLTAVDNNRRY